MDGKKSSCSQGESITSTIEVSTMETTPVIDGKAFGLNFMFASSD
jgi:hypothetical protein